MESIPLSQPAISDDDIAAVTAVLRTPRLSLGPQLAAFEEEMAAYVGARHAVAVNSGTAALHLGVRALGIGDGDEVITSPFSFVASANCILYERARPVFVDVEPETYCLDPALIERAITPRTKAILAIDIFGHIADWEALRAIAQAHDLALIEDSCEALGSARDGRYAGVFGDCGTFAFYPNKQMTTGEGGMLVTDRDDIADSARRERNQGRPPEAAWLEHTTLGFNYRLSDINCALGVSQLKRLPAFIQRRQQLVAWYEEELHSVADAILTPRGQAGVDTSWFVYVVRLRDQYGPRQRDAVIEYLRAQGIGCSNYFPPLHLQPLYRSGGYKEGDFPVTERVAERTIALPFFTALSREDIATVGRALRDGLDHCTV